MFSLRYDSLHRHIPPVTLIITPVSSGPPQHALCLNGNVTKRQPYIKNFSFPVDNLPLFVDYNSTANGASPYLSATFHLMRPLSVYPLGTSWGTPQRDANLHRIEKLSKWLINSDYFNDAITQRGIQYAQLLRLFPRLHLRTS